MPDEPATRSSGSPIDGAAVDSASEAIPTAHVRPRRVSLAWLVPLVALLAVGGLIWAQVARDQGPVITITLGDAAGIEPGAEIMHRGVTVGVVRDVALSADLESVRVSAELRPDASGLAVEGTRFWVVRAQVSLQRIAGLETLIGPRYIALLPGPAGAPPSASFVALDGPPAVAPAQDGALRLILRTDRLGALAPGAAVLYREIRVGSVHSADLSADARSVLVTVDIDPEFTPLICEGARFWRSGGVGVDFGLFSGLTVEADSLEALMSASISLATPESEKKRGERVTDHAHEFELADKADEDWLKWRPTIELGP